MNDRIQDIKQRHIKRQHELEEMDMPEMPKAHQDRDYLLSEVERLQTELEFWKQAAETQKHNNLAILKENRAMKAALEWTRKTFEEEWTYEPGVGEAVDDILSKFDTALSHLKG